MRRNIVWRILVAAATLMSFIASAQSRKPFYSREISLVHDNDILVFEDYYYTAGQDIIYRRLMDPNSSITRFFNPNHGDSSKVIVQYQGGVKIFTPADITVADVKLLDRPYAGWTFGKITFSNFPSAKASNEYQLEAGLVGPSSGMEELQKWMHQLTHFTLPKGWNYQIQNEAVVNAAYTRWQNWRLTSDLDITSQSTVQAGTGSNRIFQEITFRFIQFNPINNSVFTNSRLSWDNQHDGRKRPIEFFMFGGLGVNYVFSNIFIEGSLFSQNNPPVQARHEPWLFQNRFGFMFSRHDVSWSILFYQLSREVIGGQAHGYASIALAVRF